MYYKTVIKENWLTRKPQQDSFYMTMVFALVLFLSSYIFLGGFYKADDWMPSSYEAVFKNHQFWKAWTTLLAHGDWAHLTSNALLFLPLSFYLAGYFGSFFFPVLGLFFGGLINLIVLQTLPPQATLIGISGVVYWMGSAWLTLFILVDRRERLQKRLAIALFLSLMLFVPETYKPEISYLSHFLGYLFGILSALIFYWWNRSRFEAAEVIELIPIEDEFVPYGEEFGPPEPNLPTEENPIILKTE